MFKLISDFTLNQPSILQVLILKAKKINALNEQLNKEMPALLKNKTSIINIEEQTVVFGVKNSSMAFLVRQHQVDLLTSIQRINQTQEIDTIKVRVLDV